MLLPVSAMVMVMGAAAGADGAAAQAEYPVAVVPVLVGPLQALIAILPGILIALGGLVVTLFRWSTVKKIVRILWLKKISVVITVGVVVGAVYGLRAIWPETGPRAGTAEAVTHPWPMFRGGPERRGAVPDSPDPVQRKRVWEFTRECRTFYSSPCVVGNRVYVTSTDKGPLRDRGAIYCLDADNGAVVWKSRPRRYLATFSSPSVAGKYLVAGEGLHFTRDARIVCLDVEQNGKVLWTYRTRSHVESSPCIDLERGRVYIGAGDDGYYCLALDPDKDGTAQVLWHLPGEKHPVAETSPLPHDGPTYPDAETSPVLHDGKVYFGLGIGGNAVCCVDAETKDEIWRVATPYPVFGPPTIAGGKLFIAIGNGNYIQTAEQVRAIELEKMREAGKSEAEIAEARKHLGPVGEIWCIDLKTHAVEWTFRVGRVVLGPIAAAPAGSSPADGRLYVGSRDGKLTCLSMAGELIRTWDARSPILTSPVIGASHLYVATGAGALFCLDRETLEPVWEETLGLTGLFLSSPVVGRGHVYVGTGNDGLLCVGEPRTEKRDPIWAGRLGGPGRSGWIDRSPVPANASYAWRFPETLSAGDTEPVRTPVTPVGEAVYVAVETGARTGLVRLDLADPAAKKPTEAWFHATGLPVTDIAALADAVYVVNGQPVQTGRRLTCLDAATGEERWHRPVADGAAGRLLVTQTVLTVVDRADGLSCVDLRGEQAGRERWSAAVGAVVGSPVLAEEGLLVVAVSSAPNACHGRARPAVARGGGTRTGGAASGTATGALVALEAATGAQRWRAPLAAAPTTGPIASEGLIAVGSADGLTGHSIVNGAELWSRPVGPVEGDLVGDKERLACTVEGGALVLIDWIDGRQIARIEGVEPGLPPVFVRDALLYCTPNSVQRYDLRTGKAMRWMRTDWMGRITAPIVLTQSHGFVPTAKRGLVCARPKRR